MANTCVVKITFHGDCNKLIKKLKEIPYFANPFTTEPLNAQVNNGISLLEFLVPLDKPGSPLNSTKFWGVNRVEETSFTQIIHSDLVKIFMFTAWTEPKEWIVNVCAKFGVYAKVSATEQELGYKSKYVVNNLGKIITPN